MTDDDDELMRELADAADEREQVQVLTATVNDLAEKLAALAEKVAEKPEKKPKVWNWRDGTAEEQAEWMAELEKWITEYLFVNFPWTQHPNKIPACWKQHIDVVHHLAALYQTWCKAYVKQDDPDLAAWWLTKWERALIEGARGRGMIKCGLRCVSERGPAAAVELTDMPELEAIEVDELPDEALNLTAWSRTLT